MKFFKKKKFPDGRRIIYIYGKKFFSYRKKSIYDIHVSCPENKRPKLLKQWYYARTGRILNLKNPQTFNEKIQWLKLYDSTPLKTRLADKFLVRDWVKEKIGEKYLIPLLGVWDSFDEIDFDKLPNQFVLKCNHGSGYNIIVTDKSKFDINEARQKINNWMNEDFAFYGFELHYSAIPHKIVAEKYIDEIACGDNADYHIFCFNGKPKLFYLTNRKGLNANDRNWSFYDTELNLLQWHHPAYKKIARINPNNNLKRLFKLATVLCKGFIFVRVDLFCIGDTIYFGEMTFTPSNGLAKYTPNTWEKEFGKMIELPMHKHKINKNNK